MNVIPNFFVQLLQASVALQRIEAFLYEEEVGMDVSSLKRGVFPQNTSSGPSIIGARNATFLWVKDASQLVSSNVDTAVDAAKTVPRSEDPVFELRDISVEFPNEALSVITGESNANIAPDF